MEEGDGDGEDLTPFWLQSTTNLRHADRLRRRASSVFLSSGLVVFLLLVTAVLFLVFVVPSTLSFSAQIFKPNSVKKSWDSLNILLVLVAVLFGFLSRNKKEDRYSYYDENQSSQNKENETQKSNPSTPNQWYNYNTIEAQKSNVSTPSHQWYDYSDYQTKMEYRNPILRKNSSSYPDLREFPSTHWSYGDYQRRFFDDANVDVGRAPDPGKLHRRHRSLEEVDHLRAPPETKTVIFDTLVSRRSTEAKNFPTSSSPPPSASAPVLSPLEFRDKPKLTHESVVHKKERSRRKMEKELESTNPISALKTTPPPPPPPPPPPNQTSSKSERKRGGSTGSSSATKDFLNSLYNKKKKKQRQKSVENLDLLLHQAQAPLSFQLPPSSPPSTPPPSVFQNLFSSKKHKRKRTITVTVKSPPPVPPTPPPPPRSAPSPPRRNDALDQNPSSQFAPLTTHEPEKHTKTKSLEKLEKISNSGGESPLNRIPPPPPPPPAFFKKPAWKFVVQGDYVRLDSNTSSRSESPEPDEVISDITPPSAANAGNATPFQPSPLFCPSPDVNTKAESFITNFRAKLKLEKIHSMKIRELGLLYFRPNSWTISNLIFD